VKKVFLERGYELDDMAVGHGSKAVVYRAKELRGIHGSDPKAIKIAYPFKEEGLLAFGRACKIIEDSNSFLEERKVIGQRFPALVKIYETGIIPSGKMQEKITPETPDYVRRSFVWDSPYQIMELFDGEGITGLLKKGFFRGIDLGKIIDALIEFVLEIHELHRQGFSHNELTYYFLKDNVAVNKELKFRAYDFDTMANTEHRRRNGLLGREGDCASLRNIAADILRQAAENTAFENRVNRYLQALSETRVAEIGLDNFAESLMRLKEGILRFRSSSPIQETSISADIATLQLWRVKEVLRVFDSYSNEYRFDAYLIGGFALHFINGRIADTRDIDFAIEGRGRFTTADGDLFERFSQDLWYIDKKIHLASAFPYRKMYRMNDEIMLIDTKEIRYEDSYNKLSSAMKEKYVLIFIDNNFRLFIHRILNELRSSPSARLRSFRTSSLHSSSSPVEKKRLSGKVIISLDWSVVKSILDSDKNFVAHLIELAGNSNLRLIINSSAEPEPIRQELRKHDRGLNIPVISAGDPRISRTNKATELTEWMRKSGITCSDCSVIHVDDTWREFHGFIHYAKEFRGLFKVYFNYATPSQESQRASADFQVCAKELVSTIRYILSQIFMDEAREELSKIAAYFAILEKEVPLIAPSAYTDMKEKIKNALLASSENVISPLIRELREYLRVNVDMIIPSFKDHVFIIRLNESIDNLREIKQKLEKESSPASSPVERKDASLSLSIENLAAEKIGAYGFTREEWHSLDSRLEAIYEKFLRIMTASEINREAYQDLVKCEMAWINYYWQPQGQKVLRDAKLLAEKVRALWKWEEIKDVVIIGIGGSDLGARALHQALEGSYYNSMRNRNGPRIHFIGDNFEAEELLGLVMSINLRKTILIPISKSGTTLEPFASYTVLRNKLIKKFGRDKYAARIIAITGLNESSELYKEHLSFRAQKAAGFLGLLPVPEGIGGRYSVFTPAGMLYAAICGLDINKFLAGLKRSYERAKLPISPGTNHAYELARIFYLIDTIKHINIIGFMPFSNTLDSLSRWQRQLHNESIGKTVTEMIFMGKDGNAVLRVFFSYNQDKSHNKVFKIYGVQGEDLGLIPLVNGESKSWKLDRGLTVTIHRQNNQDTVEINDPVKALSGEIIEKIHTVGTTLYPLIGSRENHSTWQLVNAGPRDKLILFVRIENHPIDFKINTAGIKGLSYLEEKYVNAHALIASQMGTEIDATTIGVPSATLVISEKNEKNIAELMHTLMMATAILGELYDINAFDQYAVEGYKTETKKALRKIDNHSSSPVKNLRQGNEVMSEFSYRGWRELLPGAVVALVLRLENLGKNVIYKIGGVRCGWLENYALKALQRFRRAIYFAQTSLKKFTSSSSTAISSWLKVMTGGYYSQKESLSSLPPNLRNSAVLPQAGAVYRSNSQAEANRQEVEECTIYRTSNSTISILRMMASLVWQDFRGGITSIASLLSLMAWFKEEALQASGMSSAPKEANSSRLRLKQYSSNLPSQYSEQEKNLFGSSPVGYHATIFSLQDGSFVATRQQDVNVPSSSPLQRNESNPKELESNRVVLRGTSSILECEITDGSRKPVKVKVNHLNSAETKEVFRNKNRVFAELLRKAEAKEGQVYVSQMAMVAKQTFIAVIGDKEDRDFIYKVRSIVQDGRIWFFAAWKDIIVNLSDGLCCVYYGRFCRDNPWIRNVVLRRLLALRNPGLESYSAGEVFKRKAVKVEGIHDAELLLKDLIRRKNKSLTLLGDTRIVIDKEIKIYSEDTNRKAEEDLRSFITGFLKYYIVSDTHLADKTAVDIFGEKKEEAFIKFLDKIIPERAALIINGDFLDLWKAKFGHIKRRYGKLFLKLRQVRRIIYIVGNHDGDILRKPELRDALKALLPHIEIVSSWQDLDAGIILEHGNIADFYNNISWIGRSAVWILGWLERILSLRAVDRLEFYLSKSLESFVPTRLLVKQLALHYLERLLVLKTLFGLSNVTVCFGHTHNLVRPREGPINLLLKSIYGNAKVKYINCGAWVGPRINGRYIWKGKEHLTVSQLTVFQRPEVEEDSRQDIIEISRPGLKINFPEPSSSPVEGKIEPAIGPMCTGSPLKMKEPITLVPLWKLLYSNKAPPKAIGALVALIITYFNLPALNPILTKYAPISAPVAYAQSAVVLSESEKQKSDTLIKATDLPPIHIIKTREGFPVIEEPSSVTGKTEKRVTLQQQIENELAGYIRGMRSDNIGERQDTAARVLERMRKGGKELIALPQINELIEALIKNIDIGFDYKTAINAYLSLISIGRPALPKLIGFIQDPRNFEGRQHVPILAVRIIERIFQEERFYDAEIERMLRRAAEEIRDPLTRKKLQEILRDMDKIKGSSPIGRKGVPALAERVSLNRIRHIIGVPKEIKPNAERVGLTPLGVEFLTGFGVKVIVEKEAGRHHFSDRDYLDAGARLVETAKEAWQETTLIKKVKEPLESEFKYLREGLIVFTYLHLASPELKELTRQLLLNKVTGIAYETIITEEDGQKVTPVLRPMSIVAGRLGALYCYPYLMHSYIRQSNNKKEVQLTLKGINLILKIKKEYPSVSDFQGVLNGKEAVILGAGVSGEQMAGLLLEMGAKVTITDIRDKRLEQLKQIFSGFANKVTLINPGLDINNPPFNLLHKYKQADILGGCILVPGGIAPQMNKELLGEISKERPKFMVDISLDQGGNFYGSYSRHYDDPVFVDQDLGLSNKRFCVPNMPDAVGKVASIELEKTNIEYALALAMGIEEAMRIFPELESGINTKDGRIVHPEVAKAYPEFASSSSPVDDTVILAKLLPWANITQENNQEKLFLNKKLSQKNKEGLARFKGLLSFNKKIPVNIGLDFAKTIPDLKELLKYDEDYPGVCYEASYHIARLLRENKFPGAFITRWDNYQDRYENYVLVYLAGASLIISITQECYLRDKSKDLGVVIMPQGIAIENREILPWLSNWPIRYSHKFDRGGNITEYVLKNNRLDTFAEEKKVSIMDIFREGPDYNQETRIHIKYNNGRITKIIESPKGITVSSPLAESKQEVLKCTIYKALKLGKFIRQKMVSMPLRNIRGGAMNTASFSILMEKLEARLPQEIGSSLVASLVDLLKPKSSQYSQTKASPLPEQERNLLDSSPAGLPLYAYQLGNILFLNKWKALSSKKVLYRLSSSPEAANAEGERKIHRSIAANLMAYTLKGETKYFERAKQLWMSLDTKNTGASSSPINVKENNRNKESYNKLFRWAIKLAPKRVGEPWTQEKISKEAGVSPCLVFKYFSEIQAKRREKGLPLLNMKTEKSREKSNSEAEKILGIFKTAEEKAVLVARANTPDAVFKEFKEKEKEKQEKPFASVYDVERNILSVIARVSGAFRLFGFKRENEVAFNQGTFEKIKAKYQSALKEAKNTKTSNASSPIVAPHPETKVRIITSKNELPEIARPYWHDHKAIYIIENQVLGYSAFVGAHVFLDAVDGRKRVVGGTRFKKYATEEEAMIDVLRLSEGMTFKNIMAGISIGGGKFVVNFDNNSSAKREVLKDVSLVLEKEMIIFTGQDVGMTAEDVDFMAQFAPHVIIGTPKGLYGGVPTTPPTARGVYLGLKEAAGFAFEKGLFKFKSNMLADKLISIHGIGGVGNILAGYILEDKATVYATDINRAAIDTAKNSHAKYVENGKCVICELIVLPEEIYDLKTDIFSPNALGGTLSGGNIYRLKQAGVKIIGGAANNQLAGATQEEQLLHARIIHGLGMLYIPDYVINSGGVLAACWGILKYDLEKKVEGIAKTIREILEKSLKQDKSPFEIADAIAKERISGFNSSGSPVNAYPLRLPQTFETRQEFTYGQDYLFVNAEYFDLLVPNNYYDEHLGILQRRLDSLRSFFGRAPPDWFIAITQDKELTQGFVASTNIRQRASYLCAENSVFIHPYFFELPETIQDDILRHELAELLTRSHELACRINCDYFRDNQFELREFLKDIKPFDLDSGYYLELKDIIKSASSPGSKISTLSSCEKSINTILVVEDEKNLRDILQKELEDRGFVVLAAENGRQALDLLKKINIDLVISDSKMPKMSGQELCQKMSEDAQLNSIPLIFMSAYIENRTKEQLAQLEKEKGALIRTLSKPFEIEDILTAIDDIEKTQEEKLRARLNMLNDAGLDIFDILSESCPLRDNNRKKTSSPLEDSSKRQVVISFASAGTGWIARLWVAVGLFLGTHALMHQDWLVFAGFMFSLLPASLLWLQAKMLKELEELSTIDHLTRVYNRRYFDSRINQEISRAKRKNHVLSLAMIDIDHFKGFNDAYGHAEGDSVLGAVAKILQERIRPMDIVCRYGGEEFAIILPETDSFQAELVAERIRKAIERAEIDGEKEKYKATVSLGISTLSLPADTKEALINQADLALYQAKDKGRNQVVVYRDNQSSSPLQSKQVDASSSPIITEAAIIAALAALLIAPFIIKAIRNTKTRKAQQEKVKKADEEKARLKDVLEHRLRHKIDNELPPELIRLFSYMGSEKVIRLVLDNWQIISQEKDWKEFIWSLEPQNAKKKIEKLREKLAQEETRAGSPILSETPRQPMEVSSSGAKKIAGVLSIAGIGVAIGFGILAVMSKNPIFADASLFSILISLGSAVGFMVLSKLLQKIDSLKKELVVHLMEYHDSIGPLHLFLSFCRVRHINNPSIDIIYDLANDYHDLLVKAQAIIKSKDYTASLKWYALVMELKPLKEKIKVELGNSKQFLSKELQAKAEELEALFSEEIVLSRINFVKTMEWIVSKYSDYNATMQIELINRVNSEEVQIWSNKYQLKRLLKNLLANAEEAFIRFEALNQEDRLLRIALEAKENHYIIIVSDNGPGIPAALLDKVFEPGVTSKKGSLLSGYGLAICRDIVNKMGGEILVESQEGKGATFIISLPSAKSSSPIEDISPDTLALPEEDKNLVRRIRFIHLIDVPDVMVVDQRQWHSLGFSREEIEAMSRNYPYQLVQVVWENNSDMSVNLGVKGYMLATNIRTSGDFNLVPRTMLELTQKFTLAGAKKVKNPDTKVCFRISTIEPGRGRQIVEAQRRWSILEGIEHLITYSRLQDFKHFFFRFGPAYQALFGNDGKEAQRYIHATVPEKIGQRKIAAEQKDICFSEDLRQYFAYEEQEHAVTFEDYLKASGRRPYDDTIAFHIGRGARLGPLFKNAYPEDTFNSGGHVVLMVYRWNETKTSSPLENIRLLHNNKDKPVVVAFGGNAFEGKTYAEQFASLIKMLLPVAEMIKQGYQVVLAHGNGPQVGDVLIKDELGAKEKLISMPMDAYNAQTQGFMGYMIIQGLRNILSGMDIRKDVVALVTQILVDKDDPRSIQPTKPVGPWYTQEEAQRLISDRGWKIIEKNRSEQKKYRRVVPSPVPIDIIDKEAIKDLISRGTIVVACGGGGIPVVYDEQGKLRGLEGVIDKDRASALLANIVGAERLVILTAV
ncbi:MAG: diguanylate cyclase, partial [Candidatus Omnitrophota bacterium]